MRRALLAGLSFAVAACAGDSPSDAPAVAQLRVTSPTATLIAGGRATLHADVLDASGRPLLGYAPTWKSSDVVVATVDAAGTVTAHEPGPVVISATAGSVVGSIALAVIAVPVATVAILPAASTVLVGETLTLVAEARDANGAVLAQRHVDWSSSDPTVATVSAAGVVSGVAGGSASIIATIDGQTASMSLTVVAPSVAPRIDAVSPAVAAPGSQLTISGAAFVPLPSANVVTLDGLPLAVISASTTTLVAVLPSALPCGPTRNAALRVSTAIGSADRALPLQSATALALAIGEARVLDSPAASRCAELPAAGGRYLVSVVNAATSAADASAFQLRGTSGAPAAAPIAAVAGRVRVPAPRLPHAPRLATDEDAGDRAHASLLEENLRLLGRTRSPLGELAAARAARAADTVAGARAVTPFTVGSVSSLRIPNVSGGAFSGNFCSSFTTVQARTVFVGSRAIVVEDAASPFAGAMDTELQAIGDEFDAMMYDVVRDNFGDPLTMDSQLDGNGRLVMLFSPKINASGFSGFVVSCDFFPATTFPSSNVGEIFYAAVPSANATPESWRRTMRSTIVHEVKHIASFAGRIAAAGVFEEAWLEEGTARHAEELWARRVFGYAGKGNTTYAQSLYCEARPTVPSCVGKPSVMQKHFFALYDFMSAPETFSPLGRVPGATDFTYYGSAWSLVRWSIDQYAVSDPVFLRALVQEHALRGVANLERRTGHSFAELLGNWSLSWAMDDRSDYAAATPLQSMPSWQLPDIFLNLSDDFPTRFATPYPFAPRPVSFGSFVETVASLRGGSASLFELSGVQSSTQLIELLSGGGGEPSPTLRIAVARVQ